MTSSVGWWWKKSGRENPRLSPLERARARVASSKRREKPSPETASGGMREMEHMLSDEDPFERTGEEYGDTWLDRVGERPGEFDPELAGYEEWDLPHAYRRAAEQRARNRAARR